MPAEAVALATTMKPAQARLGIRGGDFLHCLANTRPTSGRPSFCSVSRWRRTVEIGSGRQIHVGESANEQRIKTTFHDSTIVAIAENFSFWSTVSAPPSFIVVMVGPA